MKLRMLKTTPVSTTGLNKLIWEKGKVYDAPEDLAANLVKGELAELKPGTKLPETPEGDETDLETPETPEGDETDLETPETPEDDETPEGDEDINGDDAVDLDKVL